MSGAERLDLIRPEDAVLGSSPGLELSAETLAVELERLADHLVAERKQPLHEALAIALGPASDNVINRIRKLPPEKVTQRQLAAIYRSAPDEADELVQRMRDHARREIRKGSLLMQALSLVATSPMDALRLQALRESLVQGLEALPGHEQELASAAALEFNLYYRWAAVELLYLDTNVVDHHPSDNATITPRQGYAQAVELAARCARRHLRQAQEALKTIALLRQCRR